MVNLQKLHAVTSFLPLHHQQNQREMLIPRPFLLLDWTIVFPRGVIWVRRTEQQDVRSQTHVYLHSCRRVRQAALLQYGGDYSLLSGISTPLLCIAYLVHAYWVGSCT
ncbi:hypothetical protein FKM82_002629 [Ascaphus truei]